MNGRLPPIKDVRFEESNPCGIPRLDPFFLCPICGGDLTIMNTDNSGGARGLKTSLEVFCYSCNKGGRIALFWVPS